MGAAGTAVLEGNPPDALIFRVTYPEHFFASRSHRRQDCTKFARPIKKRLRIMVNRNQITGFKEIRNATLRNCLFDGVHPTPIVSTAAIESDAKLAITDPRRQIVAVSVESLCQGIGVVIRHINTGPYERPVVVRPKLPKTTVSTGSIVPIPYSGDVVKNTTHDKDEKLADFGSGG